MALRTLFNEPSFALLARIAAPLSRALGRGLGTPCQEDTTCRLSTAATTAGSDQNQGQNATSPQRAEEAAAAPAHAGGAPSASTPAAAAASASSTPPAAASQPRGEQPTTSYDAMSLFARSRYSVASQEILHRELMLKTSAKHWSAVPRLKSITLTISAATDTRMERSPVPLEDLLLYLLALEKIALQPASFLEPQAQGGAGKAAGVRVTLHGEAMMNFLEKLVYMVLPNQIGFEGASPFKEVPSKAPRPGKQLANPAKEKKNYFSELKITNLMLYPDFEQEFELFEQLRGMQVRFEVEGAESPEVAAMLLGGLALPVMSSEAAVAAEKGAPAAEQAKGGKRG